MRAGRSTASAVRAGHGGSAWGRGLLRSVWACLVMGYPDAVHAEQGRSDERTPKRTMAYASRAPIVVRHKKGRPTVRTTPKFEDPLRSFHNFKSDYNYPERLTRQRFNWGAMGCEWTVRLAGVHGAYGGVRFRRSLDLATAHRRNRRLIFQMKPFDAAENLTVGLTEKDPEKVGLTLRHPLADFEAGTNGDWGYYAIDLAEFSSANPRERLNWRKVAGIKLVRFEDTEKSVVATIRNVLFEL